MDPTRSALDEPESASADTDTTYTQLVARYSGPETVAAALERVTAEARRRKNAERVPASRVATGGLDPGSGSVRRRRRLAVEALVNSTADRSRIQGQLPEHVRIWELCRETKSVAEVSALLRVTLGVARMLIADMAAAGLVAIHQPDGAGATGGRLDAELLERVLSGLRNL
ncbi:DUF742 domain-containing protein [Streptomyces sp. NPDC004237]|uniref:DUF742 domain-containing protein n=1 Tax=Streptomyces sp. NPDC004237 TaxID=3154455 RepID=UPI0033BB9D4E